MLEEIYKQNLMIINLEQIILRYLGMKKEDLTIILEELARNIEEDYKESKNDKI